jgi:hypothetical protein
MVFDEPIRFLQKFDAKIHNEDTDEDACNKRDELLEYVFA